MYIYIYICIYIYIYIYIYIQVASKTALCLPKCLTMWKGADRNKSHPPTRPCVEATGSQIEQMESLSYKIWKSIAVYIVWKQDHPPKATKRVPKRARRLPSKSHSDKALTSTFFTLSRISHKANPLDVSRCICVFPLFGFQYLRVSI